MALPTVPDERQQGAVKEQEALEANAPAPLEATPEQEDVASQESVAQSAQQAMGVGAEPDMPTQGAPEGYTVKNPYMLLPSRMLYNGFGGQPQKTQVERDYDVGILWEVLASDPQADEVTRMVARTLMGTPEPY